MVLSELARVMKTKTRAVDNAWNAVTRSTSTAPLDGMLVHKAVARLRGTVRVKCLEPEHNTMSWPGIEPRLLDIGTKCTREETIAPPTTDNVKDSKKHNYSEVIQYTWNNAPML